MRNEDMRQRKENVDMRNEQQSRRKADRQKGHTRSTPKDAKKKTKTRKLARLLITKLQDLQCAVLVTMYECQIGQKESSTYQINPATSAKLALAWAAGLESERLVERNQVFMSDNRNPICDLGLPDTVDIRL